MVRLACFALALALAALPSPAKDLQIYFIDVEGGQATLIVSPSGQSMLVDAGWPGFVDRDVDRIVAALKVAGVKQIDYMLTTHYHLDHVGGVPPLAQKFPIVTYIDHGPNNETDGQAKKLSAAYDALLQKGKHLVVKPGDRIPLKGVEIDVVAADGAVITKPQAGAGAANAACTTVERKQDDPSENARSVAFVLRYGKFSLADFADITWNIELSLACPDSKLSAADVYLVTHHGMDISNSPAILQALHPRVAISNNGVRKGGTPAAFKVIRNSPGLEDLWQLHYSTAAGAEGNSAEALIANPDANCQGRWIKLTARSSGEFTVLNGRNGFTKTYKPRAN